jgi:hypothetical protein|nr:MAG TPA: hypothetical protein [Caudoviricetes sp.]
MNTSLFVGLCEDIGLEVDFGRSFTYVVSSSGISIACISEADTALWWIDTWTISPEDAIAATKIIPEYALTPVGERE